MSNILYTSHGLEYDDVYIIPKYSTIESRSVVETTSTIAEKPSRIDLEVPVISSNMDTISGPEMVIEMFKRGGLGALHRFCTIEQAINDFKAVLTANAIAMVSIGVTRDFKERAIALYDAGARLFVVDIAHGHSLLMKQTIQWLREQFKDEVFIVAGSIATQAAVSDLEAWGANALRLGVGNGSVCRTKNVTGVTIPIFSTVYDCAQVAKVPLIADGGFKEYGDIAKAIAAGASAVMSGYFFAGCDETPPCLGITNATRLYEANAAKALEVKDYHALLDNNNKIRLTEGQKPLYRGMASMDAMMRIRDKDDPTLPTPEGMSTTVEFRGPVSNVMKDIAGALRSSMSYVGAKNISEFQSRANFGIRTKKK